MGREAGGCWGWPSSAKGGVQGHAAPQVRQRSAHLPAPPASGEAALVIVVQMQRSLQAVNQARALFTRRGSQLSKRNESARGTEGAQN